MAERAPVLHPTRSYRISPEAQELISAWASYRGEAQGVFLERFLARIPLPGPVAGGEASHPASRLREAHAALISARNGTETPT